MSAGNWKELFKAIQDGDIGLVEYHLKNGVDPNYQHPEFLAAPLVESIRLNQLEIAELLLENKADPRIKEVLGGDTPISLAEKTNNRAAIKLLKRYLND